MKIVDELKRELRYYNYTDDDIELIKIRCIRFEKFDGNDLQYDYVGNSLDDVENLEYDAGFGTQELYGYVWFKDGSWLERHEYDGSEEWVFKCVYGPHKDISLDDIITQ